MYAREEAVVAPGNIDGANTKRLAIVQVVLVFLIPA